MTFVNVDKRDAIVETSVHARSNKANNTATNAVGNTGDVCH